MTIQNLASGEKKKKRERGKEKKLEKGKLASRGHTELKNSLPFLSASLLLYVVLTDENFFDGGILLFLHRNPCHTLFICLILSCKQHNGCLSGNRLSNDGKFAIPSQKHSGAVKESLSSTGRN